METAIDWSQIEGAFGPAEEMPRALEVLASGSPERRRAALAWMRDQALHQDALSPVAPHLVDPLIDLVLGGAPDRDAILHFVDDLAFLAPGRPDRPFPVIDAEQAELAQAVVDRLSRRVAELVPLASDPDRTVRVAAARLLSSLPLDSAALAALVAGLDGATELEERCVFLLALAAHAPADAAAREALERGLGSLPAEPLASAAKGIAEAWAQGRPSQGWVSLAPALEQPARDPSRFPFCAGDVALLVVATTGRAAAQGDVDAQAALVDWLSRAAAERRAPHLAETLRGAVDAALFAPLRAQSPDLDPAALPPESLTALEKLTALGVHFEGLPSAEELRHYVSKTSPLGRTIEVRAGAGSSTAPVWKWLRALRRGEAPREALADALRGAMSPRELLLVATETLAGVMAGAVSPGGRTLGDLFLDVLGPSLPSLRAELDAHARGLRKPPARRPGERAFSVAARIGAGSLDPSTIRDDLLLDILREDASVAPCIFATLPLETRERLVLRWPHPYEPLRWMLAARAPTRDVVEAAVELARAAAREDEILPEILDALRAIGAAHPELRALAWPPLASEVESAVRRALG